MQRQVFLKVREPHKLLQGGGAHLLDSTELHVVVHERKICSVSSLEKRNRLQMASAMRTPTST